MDNKKFLHTFSSNIIWYITPKCGSRTLHKIFRENNINFPTEKYDEVQNFTKNYFSFSIVRNPWDRLLSCYTQKIVKQKPPAGQKRPAYFRWELNYQKPSFKDFIRIIAENKNIKRDRHWDLYHNIIPVSDIDFIGRFENLQEDFNIVCDKIGIPQQQLPHQNKSKHKHYTEYYDDETRQIVAEKYAKDIEYFGYTYEK
jgi:hypothetical protein